MNNLIFEKIYEDDSLVELRITAISEYVQAFQDCYIDKEYLNQIGEKIHEYANIYDKECYLEFGKKEGDYTPSFSMKLLPANFLGHLKIEVDVEIADNDKREHRCCFFVESELGLIGRLGEQLKNVANGKVGDRCSIRYK